MPDPTTLSALGVVALTEGVKFLYAQASEVLKRWRERRDIATKDAKAVLPKEEPIAVDLPLIFEGQLSSVHIHFDAVERLEKQLLELKRGLSGYADESEKVESADETLLEQIDALRQLLEAVYQQRITFKGEQRPPSGPVVEGRIDVEEIAGYTAAIRARLIVSGSVKADVKAKRVEPAAQLIGVDTDIIGGEQRKDP